MSWRGLDWGIGGVLSVLRLELLKFSGGYEAYMWRLGV